MNKKTLIKKVSEKVGLTECCVKSVVDALFEEISENVMNNDERIELRGFGTFLKGTRNERNGINPSTREKITIPASEFLKFKQAKRG